LGLGRAVLPKHLIQKEKDFKIIRPEIVLKVQLYLLYYKQPYYSKLHQQVTDHIQGYFKQNF